VKKTHQREYGVQPDLWTFLITTSTHTGAVYQIQFRCHRHLSTEMLTVTIMVIFARVRPPVAWTRMVTRAGTTHPHYLPSGGI